ncbi:MAG: hypothetical protein PHO37_07835 [Kiritimatiellae bacterium]|nr:hypothetical protein [Kiritimatiellia bacterium]
MQNIKPMALIAAAAALILTTSACKQEVPDARVEQQPGLNSQLNAEFKALQGKWRRSDSDYVIELRELLPDNQMTAAYFNPGPIHVGEAKIYRENSFLKVFVKMQDKNYPGSSYTLIYDQPSDRLRGIYFQAVQGVEYEVEFTRVP